jgi:hypothetical protein
MNNDGTDSPTHIPPLTLQVVRSLADQLLREAKRDHPGSLSGGWNKDTAQGRLSEKQIRDFLDIPDSA